MGDVEDVVHFKGATGEELAENGLKRVNRRSSGWSTREQHRAHLLAVRVVLALGDLVIVLDCRGRCIRMVSQSRNKHDKAEADLQVFLRTSGLMFISLARASPLSKRFIRPRPT